MHEAIELGDVDAASATTSTTQREERLVGHTAAAAVAAQRVADHYHAVLQELHACLCAGAVHLVAIAASTVVVRVVVEGGEHLLEIVVLAHVVLLVVEAHGRGRVDA